MQPFCCSRERNERQDIVPLPSPRHTHREHESLSDGPARPETKAPQKEMQFRADLDQQRSDFLVLKNVVEDLTSQFLKMGLKVKKLDEATVRLMKEDKEKAKTLFDIDGRLHDFQLTINDISRDNTRISRDETLSTDGGILQIPEEPMASNARVSEEIKKVETLEKDVDNHVGMELSNQIGSLKAEMIDLRSRVNNDVESLQASHRELAQLVRGQTADELAAGDDEDIVDIDAQEDKGGLGVPHWMTREEIYGRKLPLPGEVKQDKESVERHFHLHREYQWAASVYDALFLVRLPFITPAHSALIVLSFTLNVIMQFLMVMNLNTDEFTSPPFEETESLRVWRYTEAHSYVNTNPVTGVPLIRRVCNMEGGLSLANTQRDDVQTIDTYLRPLIGIPQQGRILCTIAILAWYLCCAQEVRQTIDFSIALMNLPRADETAFAVQAEGFSFVSVSKPRLALGGVIAGIRLATALVLFVCGARWIAYELDVVDLLLNASALAFVLEIDNYLFAITAPYRIIGLMQALMPVRLPRSKGLIFIPLSLIWCSLVWVIIVNVWILDGNVAAMEDALALMCDPESSQRYIVGSNPIGWTTWTLAAPRSGLEQHVQEVIRGIVTDHGKDPGVGLRLDTFNSVVQVNAMSVSQFVSEPQYGCNNNNAVSPKGGVGNRLYALSGEASYRNMSGCEDIAQYCRREDLLGINARFMCPCTCGCADIHAGLWDLAKVEYGCPARQCMNKVDRVLSGSTAMCAPYRLPPVPCIDGNVTQLLAAGWRPLLSRMLERLDINEAQYQNLSTMGCAALTHFPYNPRLTLCSMREPVTNYGFGPFCPESCGCAWATAYGLPTDCPGLCPNTCCMANRATRGLLGDDEKE